MFRCHLQCIRLVRECAGNLHLKLALKSFSSCTNLSAFPAEGEYFGVPSQTLRGETSPSFWGHKDTRNRVKLHKDPLLRKGDLAGTWGVPGLACEHVQVLRARVASDFCFLSQGFQSDAAAFASVYAQVWKTCFKSRLVLSILMHGLKSLTTFPHWQACKNNSQNGRRAVNMPGGPGF